jgi:hypothetical protein
MSTEWCLDATHDTCRSFTEDGKKAYLFSIVLKNPITNQGAPVAYMITNHQYIWVIAEWLKWLVDIGCGSKVVTIMIDCDAAEISAIKEAFGNRVKILLCHWHLKRSWERKIKSTVSISQMIVF